jgi:hypothetical protein
MVTNGCVSFAVNKFLEEAYGLLFQLAAARRIQAGKVLQDYIVPERAHDGRIKLS